MLSCQLLTLQLGSSSSFWPTFLVIHSSAFLRSKAAAVQAPIWSHDVLVLYCRITAIRCNAGETARDSLQDMSKEAGHPQLYCTSTVPMRLQRWLTPIRPAQMQVPRSAHGVEFVAHPILSPPWQSPLRKTGSRYEQPNRKWSDHSRGLGKRAGSFPENEQLSREPAAISRAGSYLESWQLSRSYSPVAPLLGKVWDSAAVVGWISFLEFRKNMGKSIHHWMLMR